MWHVYGALLKNGCGTFLVGVICSCSPASGCGTLLVGVAWP